jgi:ATP-dependent RNA helicase RhlE
MPFVSLGLSPALAQPLARLGYTTPTPVQLAAIPVALQGRDVLARAQTGTGKTAAFGLPMIQRLTADGPRNPVPKRPRALVLVPTRELALQVSDALHTYGTPMRVRVAAIFGGVNMRRQVMVLQKGVDIVVATPGRLIDHLQQQTVDLSSVSILVLDEADRMLDMGFLPPLRRILESVPKDRQTLLLSATLPAEVQSLAATFMRNAERIDCSPAATVAATVSHHVHYVTQDRKRALLVQVLSAPENRQTLVFCRTKHGSNRVGRHLETSGLKTAVIHGDKSQNARTRALADFKAGRIAVLVATDVAARGLDIEQLPLVMNYDLPLVAEDYVHRIGRTGRAGSPGRAVSLVSEGETALLRDIQKLLPAPLEVMSVAGFETAPFAASAAAPSPARRSGSKPSGAGRASSSGRRSFDSRGAGAPGAPRAGGMSRPASAGRPGQFSRPGTSGRSGQPARPGGRPAHAGAFSRFRDSRG